MPNEQSNDQPAAKVNLGRHQRNCKICAHPQREEIESEFISWKGPEKIAEQFGLHDRSSVYRHAVALGLYAARRRNVRSALERIIERSGDVEVTASAVVAAVQAYSKINAAGQWIDRTEQVSMNELFNRMTRDELERYAQTGDLPEWFSDFVGATGMNSHEEGSI